MGEARANGRGDVEGVEKRRGSRRKKARPQILVLGGTDAHRENPGQ